MADTQSRYNRDDELKPGRPPRSATEPSKPAGADRSGKTLTHPSTGEPEPAPPRPNRSAHDDA